MYTVNTALEYFNVFYHTHLLRMRLNMQDAFFIYTNVDSATVCDIWRLVVLTQVTNNFTLFCSAIVQIKRFGRKTEQKAHAFQVITLLFTRQVNQKKKEV